MCFKNLILGADQWFLKLLNDMLNPLHKLFLEFVMYFSFILCFVKIGTIIAKSMHIESEMEFAVFQQIRFCRSVQEHIFKVDVVVFGRQIGIYHTSSD